MGKEYDGTGDPHDRIAWFKQVLRAEQVIDIHTQVEGFGCVMGGCQPICTITHHFMLLLFESIYLSNSIVFDSHLEKATMESFSKADRDTITLGSDV